MKLNKDNGRWWVDKIFEKLFAVYGYSCLFPVKDDKLMAIVKNEWYIKLQGTKDTSIKYALDNLPLKPINLMEFLELCNKAPQPTFKAIEVAKQPINEEIQNRLKELKNKMIVRK